MYIGIDIGTGSLKAILGLQNGTVTIAEKYETGMSLSGIHKTDLFKISVQKFLTKIADYCNKNNELIEGISFCSHGPSLLIVDKEGTPRTDIITWQDNSAIEEARDLSELIEGFSKDGTCYEAKLLKLNREQKNILLNNSKVLSPKDYVIYLLCDRMILDYSTAATIAYFNSGKRDFTTYSTGIPLSVFPEIIESWETAGKTGTEFSKRCGFNDGINIIAGGIDAWCEAIGAGAIDDGMMVDGTGTSTCITCCKHEDSAYLPHVIPAKSLKIETMSSTGSSIGWLKELLGIELDDIRKIDSFVPVPVIFLPYLDGERSPVWDEKASASFVGLNSESSREELIKSVLQGISFGTKQCIDLTGSMDIKSIRAVGGGANNRALLQFKADISGLTYHSMKETDAAPLGAMILAAFSCGDSSIRKLTEKWVEINYTVEPNKGFTKVWDQLSDIYNKQYSLLKDVSHNLNNIKKILMDNQ